MQRSNKHFENDKLDKTVETLLQVNSHALKIKMLEEDKEAAKQEIAPLKAAAATELDQYILGRTKRVGLMLKALFARSSSKQTDTLDEEKSSTTEGGYSLSETEEATFIPDNAKDNYSRQKFIELKQLLELEDMTAVKAQLQHLKSDKQFAKSSKTLFAVLNTAAFQSLAMHEAKEDEAKRSETFTRRFEKIQQDIYEKIEARIVDLIEAECKKHLVDCTLTEYIFLREASDQYDKQRSAASSIPSILKHISRLNDELLNLAANVKAHPLYKTSDVPTLAARLKENIMFLYSELERLRENAALPVNPEAADKFRKLIPSATRYQVDTILAVKRDLPKSQLQEIKTWLKADFETTIDRLCDQVRAEFTPAELQREPVPATNPANDQVHGKDELDQQIEGAQPGAISLHPAINRKFVVASVPAAETKDDVEDDRAEGQPPVNLKKPQAQNVKPSAPDLKGTPSARGHFSQRDKTPVRTEVSIKQTKNTVTVTIG